MGIVHIDYRTVSSGGPNESWGKRGAEGTGPWGPHGPAGPCGPLTQRWFESLRTDLQPVGLVMLAAKIAAGTALP